MSLQAKPELSKLNTCIETQWHCVRAAKSSILGNVKVAAMLVRSRLLCEQIQVNKGAAMFIAKKQQQHFFLITEGKIQGFTWLAFSVATWNLDS